MDFRLRNVAKFMDSYRKRDEILNQINAKVRYEHKIGHVH